MGDEDLKQVWRLLMKGCLALFIIGACLGGCAYLNREVGLDDDNSIENFFEDVVEFQLGLPADSIDFTPNSHE
jgi:hypothetical protein